MQTQNSTYRRGSGKYQPQPDYTPIYGVRLFALENGLIAAVIAMMIYAAARLYMCITEQQNASSFDPLSLLGMLAAVLLCAGGLVYMLAASARGIPGVVLFFGLLMLLASDIIFCVILTIDTLSESSLLGVVQSLLEILLLGSLAAALTVLLISCLGRKTAPWVGSLTGAAAILAAALTAVRVVSTFASLTTALGTGFSWDNAASLHAELGWVMRTVSPDSDYAERMYYARLFERIALVLLYAAMLPLCTRFTAFFKQYNNQMDISAELPGRHNVKKQRGTPYATGHFDLLSSFYSLREQDKADMRERRGDEPEPAAPQNDSTPLLAAVSDCAGDFDDSGLVYIPLKSPEEESVPQQKAAVSPEPESETETPAPPAAPVRYNTGDMLDENYGLPIEEEAQEGTPEEASATAEAESTSAQRVTLKPRSPYLAPDDPMLWNRYTQ